MIRIAKRDIQKPENYTAVAVRCPVCHKGRLMDVAEGTDISQMHLFSSDQRGRSQWYMKCPKCGRQIGISFGRPKQTIH